MIIDKDKMSCGKDGCKYAGKVCVDGEMFCGYHKRGHGNEIVKRQVAFVRCSGVTKKGSRCRRSGTTLDIDCSYCHMHKSKSKAIKPDEKLQNQINEDCSICYNPLNNYTSLSQTHCGHLFHKDCILKWIEKCPTGNTCPLCKRHTHIKRGAPTKVRMIYTAIECF